MDGCNFQDRCCFLKRMAAADAPLWENQLRSYCYGALFSRCERRQFFLETGDCAPAHMTPSGEVPGPFLPQR